MFTGISTSCFYPMETEKALDLLLEKGGRCLEVFLNSFSEMEPAYLKGLARACRDRGARVVSLHPFTSGWEGYLFFSEYSRRFADSVDLYRRFFEGAAILGAELVVFHGAQTGMEVPMDRYAHRFALLDQAAREGGIRLCHENVCRTVSRSADFFRQLRRLYPQGWFVLDVKQAVRAGEDPFAVLEAMGNRVAHVHISDNAPGESCLPPGRGTMDLAGLVARLGEQGYGGCLMVELYRRGFATAEDLLESCRWLETLPGVDPPEDGKKSCGFSPNLL